MSLSFAKSRETLVAKRCSGCRRFMKSRRSPTPRKFYGPRCSPPPSRQADDANVMASGSTSSGDKLLERLDRHGPVSKLSSWRQLLTDVDAFAT